MGNGSRLNEMTVLTHDFDRLQLIFTAHVDRHRIVRDHGLHMLMDCGGYFAGAQRVRQSSRQRLQPLRFLPCGDDRVQNRIARRAWTRHSK